MRWLLEGLSRCGRAQPVLDRPGRDLGPRVEAELVEDALDVTFGRPLGDDQARGNLAVGESSGRMSRHIHGH